jgi:hypothetical protein
MIPGAAGARAAALALALLLAGAAPALAHAPAPRPLGPGALAGGHLELAVEAGRHAVSLRADVPALALSHAVVGLAAMLVLLPAARRLRRAVAAVAVLALIALAFEGGLHSVHHLGDERGAAQCSTASATTHLAGTLEEPVAVVAGALPTLDAPPAVAGAALEPAAFRLDPSRGPPPPTA